MHRRFKIALRKIHSRETQLFSLVGDYLPIKKEEGP